MPRESDTQVTALWESFLFQGYGKPDDYPFSKRNIARFFVVLCRYTLSFVNVYLTNPIYIPFSVFLKLYLLETFYEET